MAKEGVEASSAFFHYAFLMRISGLLGDKKRFREWGFKAVLLSVHFTDEGGEDGCRQVEQWINWIREPEKKFPDWGRYRR